MVAQLGQPPIPSIFVAEEPRADQNDYVGTTDTETVMAESSTRDVVNQALSVGDSSPADVPATNNHNSATRGEEEKELSEKQDHADNNTPHTFQNAGPIKPVEQAQAPPSDTDSINGRSTPSNVRYTNGGAHEADFPAENRSTGTLNDASGGSDTDTSRPDGSRGNSNDASSSVKKSSFKPVSFAKYSVNKGGLATPTTKPVGDKATLSTSSSSTPVLQTSRPRLVAKTGGGLRDSSSKAFKSGEKNGAGPDPMQVWNKNRATPIPSTKHLTDEELKQQYGIHMTSRIQADADGKEAKWADIDDDEDDWAPETIEWNDGTKISLEQTLPAPVKDLKPSTPPIDPSATVPAKKALTPQITSTVGPNATILKVGQNAEKQARAAASQPKGSTEGSLSSSNKTPAPLPAKSPWAPVPPVAKSPIETIPQQQASQSRGYFPPTGQQPQRTSTQSPAQEISADDFNRNWRDAQPNGPRELFMPNSGRYEAVNEGRRRPSRNEQNFRQPAVLQRPGGNDSRAPAEPSAAFQTSRVSADQDRQWGRRRASSNVSGGSGQFARRMSASRGSDVPLGFTESSQHQRRGSKAQASAPHLYQAQGPPRGMSPAQLSASHDSPSLSHVSTEAISASGLQNADPNVPPVLQEDPIIVQKRIMAEKREAARKRRLEEEEREEAARRERIRLKLEALGPAPAKSVPQKHEPLDSTATAGSAPPKDSYGKVGEENVTTTTLNHSPPKPPVPEASGEPKQYGMMKVHHPDTVKKMMPQSLGSQPHQHRPMDGSISNQPGISSTHEPRSDPLKPSQPMVNGIRQGSDDVRSLDRVQENVSKDKTVRSWNENITNTPVTSPWAGSRSEQQTPKVSVWGNNTVLGNGTFDHTLNEFGAARQLPPPGRPGRSTLWAHERSPFPSMELSPQASSTSPLGVSDLAQTVPSFPPPEDHPLAADSEVDTILPASRPMPIGPPQAHPVVNAPGPRAPQAGIAAWNNFPSVAAREDRAANERFRQDLTARIEDEARTGARQPPAVTYNETWRQVDAGDQAGQRQVVGVARSINGPQPVPAFGSIGPMAQDIGPKAAPVTSAGQRASRFFPHGGITHLQPQERRAVTFSQLPVPTSPSPPPPEELGHPAFTGNVQKPLVSLPKPKAVVRLPPKETASAPVPASAVSAPVHIPRTQPRTTTWSAVVGQRATSNPMTKSDPKQQSPQQSWQSRFNALLDKKDGPTDKKQSLAVASSTKDALDVSPEAGMTVSLPTAGQAILTGTSKITSKDVEEEDEIFEDRVAGSLPVVKVPLEVPPSAALPLPSKTLKSRFVKNVEPTSIKNFYDGIDRSTIIIHLPGTTTKKSILTKRIDHVGAVSKPSRNTHTGSNPSKTRRGPKSRESSGSFKPTQQSQRSLSNPQQSSNSHVPSPRAGLTQQSSHGWKGSRQAAGVAH